MRGGSSGCAAPARWSGPRRPTPPGVAAVGGRSAVDQIGDRGEIGSVDGIAAGVGDRRSVAAIARRRSGIIIGEPEHAARPEQRRPAATEDAGGGQHGRSMRRAVLPPGCRGGLRGLVAAGGGMYPLVLARGGR
jgi:hypothetical protein